MEFFDKMIIPSSGSTLELMKYLLSLALVIFSIYSGVLLTSSVMSFIFKIIAARKNNDNYFRMSKDYIDLITPNKTMAIGLGIVPFFSIIIIYIQIFNNFKNDIILFFLVSLCFFFVAQVLLYLYKYSFKHTSSEGNVNRTGSINTLTGLIGIIFLIFSLRLFFGLVVLSLDSGNWNFSGSLLSMLFELQVVINFIQFITLSASISSVAFIVKYFYWDKQDENINQEYINKSGIINSWIAIGFAFIQPFILLIDFYTMPDNLLNNNSYLFGMLSLIALLIFLHLAYAGVRYNNFRNISYSFYLILLTFTLIILKSQSSFSLSSGQQLLTLTDNYDKLELALLEKEGKKGPQINGAEIYNAKCTACHKFDQKLVGPPHKEVMAKYLNNKEGMVKFILNPVKVNPEYPEMPNQALKPKEAEAVVDFMFKEYGNKLN
ncbi:MAG: cytochrome c [Ignavibacteriae bacterium]|nr:cytochrome c [Ignavibacteriota bacterium]